MKVGRIYKIDDFPWGRPDGSPESHAEIEFLEEGIFTILRSNEGNPRCTVTMTNGPVYQDSCMEFFFCPCPEQSIAYYKFELNALGTLYVGFSPDGTRKMSSAVDPAELIGKISVHSHIDRENCFWNVSFLIPYDFIRRRMPDFKGKKQKYITGNFYKCGDYTENPHYAVWNHIDSNIITKPDFHVAKYFGKIEL